MRLHLTALLPVGSIAGAPVLKAQEHGISRRVLCACASFAPDGTSAAATVDADGILLEITRPSGARLRLRLPLPFPADTQTFPQVRYQCRAYADQKAGLVAVGVLRNGFPQPDQMQVAVANIRTGAWIGNWTVGQDSGICSPSLAGFVEGAAVLAVSGIASVSQDGQRGAGIQHGRFLTLSFDPSGNQLTPVSAARTYSSDQELFPAFADARNNRLWVFRCTSVSVPLGHQPICPISPVALTGGELRAADFTPPMQGKKRTDLWFGASSFAAPNSGLVIFAEGGTLWAWTCKHTPLIAS